MNFGGEEVLVFGVFLSGGGLGCIIPVERHFNASTHKEVLDSSIFFLIMVQI